MTTDQERYEVLAMGAVDGVLTDSERQELAALVDDHPERAAELADFMTMKEATDAMRNRITASAQIEPPRPSAATKGTLNLGFALIWAGLIGLYGYGAYEFATDPTIPTWTKGAGGLLGAGLLILFFSALRTRLRGLARDPYREIDR